MYFDDRSFRPDLIKQPISEPHPARAGARSLSFEPIPKELDILECFLARLALGSLFHAIVNPIHASAARRREPYGAPSQSAREPSARDVAANV